MTPMQWTPISSRAAWRGLGLLSLVGGLTAAAGDAGAKEPAKQLVTDFAITELEIQKAPTTFKFQSRISQAKMPVGNQQFTKIIVNLVRGGSEVLCREELVNVMVRDSVLNLDIGRGFTCALDDIIARNADLSFQICLNREENCLKPVALASVPYAVKASFSHQAEQAHKADVAAQCHYAHRVTADLGLLDPANRDVIGAGYYDFQTTPGDAIDGESTVAGSNTAADGFFQWAPTAPQTGAASGDLHMCMRAVSREGMERLTDLRTIELHAQTTTAHGRLLVDLPKDGILPTTTRDEALQVYGDFYVAGTARFASIEKLKGEVVPWSSLITGSSDPSDNVPTAVTALAAVQSCGDGTALNWSETAYECKTVKATWGELQGLPEAAQRLEKMPDCGGLGMALTWYAKKVVTATVNNLQTSYTVPGRFGCLPVQAESKTDEGGNKVEFNLGDRVEIEGVYVNPLDEVAFTYTQNGIKYNVYR